MARHRTDCLCRNCVPAGRTKRFAVVLDIAIIDGFREIITMTTTSEAVALRELRFQQEAFADEPEVLVSLREEDI